MKFLRRSSESEDQESVLELFLDVLLCGFGAALSLMVIYSVLPKAGPDLQGSVNSSGSDPDTESTAVSVPDLTQGSSLLTLITVTCFYAKNTKNIDWSVLSAGNPINATSYKVEGETSVMFKVMGAEKIDITADQNFVTTQAKRIIINITTGFATREVDLQPADPSLKINALVGGYGFPPDTSIVLDVISDNKSVPVNNSVPVLEIFPAEKVGTFKLISPWHGTNPEVSVKSM
jgi:hypothetical protein